MAETGLAGCITSTFISIPTGKSLLKARAGRVLPTMPREKGSFSDRGGPDGQQGVRELSHTSSGSRESGPFPSGSAEDLDQSALLYDIQ